MRIILTAIAMVVLSALPATAQTAAAPAAKAAALIKPAVSACANLARDYEATSKELAENSVEGLVDNSAPRATLRAAEDANSLAQARITLDLMRDNKCSLPKSAPDSAYYLMAALGCRSDRLKATGTESPASCDKNNWQRSALKE